MSQDTTTPLVSEYTHSQVREIRLNQAEAHNSLSVNMGQALLQALDRAEQDQSVRALLLSADGKSFCAGGDLREMLTHKADLAAYVGDAMERVHNPLIQRLTSFPVPVIIAVQGAAVGAGAGLALAGDLTVAGSSAKFILPFLDKLAIVPDAGTSHFLSQALGRQRSMGHLLTGEPISAQQAMDYGLIWQCVPDEDLPTYSLDLAMQAAQRASATVQRTRHLLNLAPTQTLDAQLAAERALQIECFASANLLEGINAFRSGRPPEFKPE